MPKSVFFQHQFLDNLLNRQGFFRSPEQKDEAINFASLSRFQELYGDDAEYAPGVPLPRRAYQLTQDINDKLQPFLRELLVVRPGTTFATDQLGADFERPVEFVYNNKFLLPSGWVHPVAMHFIEQSADGLTADMSNYLYPSGDAKMIRDDKQGRRRRSKIAAPDQQHPIFVTDQDGYRVTPLPDGLLYVKYLGLPPKSLYAYTIDDAGEILYNDADSVDTKWPEIDQNDILMKAAELLGVPLQDAQLMQFARGKAQTGA